ncbi:MAG: ABC transporter ATP-binding protein [Pseudobutyrivibrio ruminis]|uniref:ABC transporter ATP-binding protein n=1 Tax=Pseudobutyrivibrio ruminis TaxID=46206 RepID=A0A927U942_9FIRM|nr:ABC transporter ATP-binding protein [Pseudobutyrivibrio ruminis]
MKRIKEKGKYNTFQNFMWMVKRSKISRVPYLLWISILSGILACIINVVGMLTTPMILDLLESGKSIAIFMQTISLVIGLLIVLTGVKTYLHFYMSIPKISCRTGIIESIAEKFSITSFPNVEDEKFLKLQEKASSASNNNSKATEDIWNKIEDLVRYSFSLLIYFVILTKLKWWILLLIIGTSVLEHTINRQIVQWQYNHRDEEATLFKRVMYFWRQSKDVGLGKDIRIFGMKSWLMDMFDDAIRTYEAFISKRERKYIWMNVLDLILSFLRNGVAYIYVAKLVVEGNLPASLFVLYIATIGNLTEQMLGIMDTCNTMNRYSMEINVVREYFDYKEQFRFEGGIKLPNAVDGKYEIELKNVSFRYPNNDTDTLHNINLRIAPGEKVAVVGLNGAGKTTLIRLISGFYDPTEGEVLLNGINIKEFNRREYYRLFSAVFQEFSILDATINDNITLEDDATNPERVWEVISKAGLEVKVKNLPDGLNTIIGKKIYENGVLLSGGEEQRLILARALYKDAPILLLDEPTAALDPIAENDIYHKYNSMTNGKTSVFISHRLASTRFCDRILLLDKGRIIEEGTHDSLILSDGEYAKLFYVQKKYYQKEAIHG